MMTWRKQHRGFSLVELLIAFFVLLVGILAVLVLFPLGLRESKTMVDASMASFAARNARTLMEVYPFTYNGGSKNGNGVASLIQIRFGPRGTKGNIIYDGPSFPVMFPAGVLGTSEDETFPLSRRPLDPNTGSRDRVLYAENSQFSWDARFTLGGGPGLTPPPGFDGPDAMDYVDYWRTQYFNYYAVQISVYRRYEILGGLEIPGTIWVKAAEKPGGGQYAGDDPNRPLYSELVVSSQPPPDLMVDSHIRVLDDGSDWYRVTDVTYHGNKWTFRLGRPYTGLNIGTQDSVSAAKNRIIGTNSLIESFTTILGSQLDDINTSNVAYP